MAFSVAAYGRLALTDGEGVVGVTVYELDATEAVARDTNVVSELIASSGYYVAQVSVPGARRGLWAVFDDGAGQHSIPFYIPFSDVVPQVVIY